MSNKAFTLIEMLVSVAIFTLLVSASSGIFLSSLRAQRQSLATQEVLDQSSYLMEYMSRALRMAKKDLSGNCITAKMNYENPGGDISKLRFIKFNHELNQDICQEFLLEGNQLKERKSSDSSAANLGAAVPLTSPKLQVSQFNVNLSGQYQPPIDYLQPRLTIFLEIKGKEQSNIKIQTTISQRNLDIRK